MPKGIAIWFNEAKGFGGSPHYSATARNRFETLAQGNTVSFDVVDGDKD